MWGYASESILFQKIDDKTFALVVANESNPHVHDQIDRCRKVIRKAGLVYKDLRKVAKSKENY